MTDQPRSETPSITIRAAAPGDAAPLGRLGALLVTLHHDYDASRFIAPGPGTAASYRGFLVSQLRNKEAIVLVAEEAGAVVGYVYAGLEGADWMALRGPAGAVYDLIVDPEHRGRGVGRQLLGRILEALAARGAPRVVLSTAAPNEAAQRLFASAGFRPTMVEMTMDWPQ